MQLGGPAKRARCSSKLILPHNVSLRSAHQLLQQLGHTTAGYTAWKQEKVQEVDNISTPYGNLLVRLELELVEGGTWKWPICNPMALLYHMCKESLAFARLLQRSQRGSGVFCFCLYADEETPGNNQHPDVPKESQCFIGLSTSSLTGFGPQKLAGGTLVL